MHARVLFHITAAMIAGLAVASCGGDKPARGGGEAQPSSNQEELVSAGALLKQSAERAGEISTMSGSFSMDMDVAGQDFSFAGDMAFADPGAMHMTMRILGREMEILMLAPDMYIHIPGEDGWILVDVAALGIDPAAFQQYLDNHGIVDFQDLADKLEDAEQLPNDDIDGTTYAHYRGEFDYADLINDPSASQFITGETRELLKDSTGAVSVDTWVDPDTLLPRRIVMDMDVEMGSLGQDMQMTMTMDFLEYNGEVNIPDAPADARPLSELAGEG
ncbi:MAG: hypothetical protein HY873_02770 [Chloroflexi bacterium]|nr:hypothetical protein [Chloroflexota bacterium]